MEMCPKFLGAFHQIQLCDKHFECAQYILKCMISYFVYPNLVRPPITQDGNAQPTNYVEKSCPRLYKNTRHKEVCPKIFGENHSTQVLRQNTLSSIYFVFCVSQFRQVHQIYVQSNIYVTGAHDLPPPWFRKLCK